MFYFEIFSKNFKFFNSLKAVFQAIIFYKPKPDKLTYCIPNLHFIAFPSIN